MATINPRRDQDGHIIAGRPSSGAKATRPGPRPAGPRRKRWTGRVLRNPRWDIHPGEGCGPLPASPARAIARVFHHLVVRFSPTIRSR
jgi:hypothetical protein